jgi:hypothetical protein
MGAALPFIAVAATVAGSVIQARGAQQAGEAQAQASQYQAQVARNNQAIAEQYAQQDLARGSVEAQTKQMETAQRVGAIRAVAGASGLDPGGSPLRLSADTLAMGDLDARTIRYNAEQSAYGRRVQAAGFGAQAGLDVMTAADARRAGGLGATGAIISGGASVADKWMRYRQTGTTGAGDPTVG